MTAPTTLTDCCLTVTLPPGVTADTIVEHRCRDPHTGETVTRGPRIYWSNGTVTTGIDP